MKLSILLLTSSLPYLNAASIVQWGNPAGDTGIVTANASGVNQFGSTFSFSSIGSPANNTSGYLTSVAGQTRTFYGAMSVANSVPIINQHSSGDRIQMVNNFSVGSTLTSMIAWNAADFLTSDRELESMTVDFASRGGDGTTMQFLIQTTSGWYQSSQSGNTTSGNTTYTTLSGNATGLTWSGFNNFGVTAGTGIADLTDLQSVGLFSTSTSSSNGFIGGLVRNFQVEAVPEPSTSLLSGLAALSLLIRRRR